MTDPYGPDFRLTGAGSVTRESLAMSGRRDQSRLMFELIEWMHSAGSIAALHGIIRDGISTLVPGECVDLVQCCNRAEDDKIFHAKPDTYTDDEIAYMLAHAAEHPVARAFGAGASGATSVSQCVSDRVWRSSSLYREGGYSRLGLRHEVAVDICGVSQHSLAVMSVVRGGPDFTAGEKEVLNLLRPHVARAWTQARRRSMGLSAKLLREVFPVLSTREAEILFWVVEGKLNAEIAMILRVRLGTVQEHVENIVRKLGMENRHQMTVAVLRACSGPAGIV